MDKALLVVGGCNPHRDRAASAGEPPPAAPGAACGLEGSVTASYTRCIGPHPSPSVPAASQSPFPSWALTPSGCWLYMVLQV